MPDCHICGMDHNIMRFLEDLEDNNCCLVVLVFVLFMWVPYYLCVGVVHVLYYLRLQATEVQKRKQAAEQLAQKKAAEEKEAVAAGAARYASLKEVLLAVDAAEYEAFFLKEFRIAEPAEFSFFTDEDWRIVQGKLKGVQYPKLKKYLEEHDFGEDINNSISNWSEEDKENVQKLFWQLMLDGFNDVIINKFKLVKTCDFVHLTSNDWAYIKKKLNRFQYRRLRSYLACLGILEADVESLMPNSPFQGVLQIGGVLEEDNNIPKAVPVVDANDLNLQSAWTPSVIERSSTPAETKSA